MTGWERMKKFLESNRLILMEAAVVERPADLWEIRSCCTAEDLSGIQPDRNGCGTSGYEGYADLAGHPTVPCLVFDRTELLFALDRIDSTTAHRPSNLWGADPFNISSMPTSPVSHRSAGSFIPFTRHAGL